MCIIKGDFMILKPIRLVLVTVLLGTFLLTTACSHHSHRDHGHDRDLNKYEKDEDKDRDDHHRQRNYRR